MVVVGELLERRADGIKAGEGIGLLHRAQILASALKPAADPKGAAAYEMGDPDFAIFEIDFESELRKILTAVLKANTEG
jgi:hypothetical protein